MTARIDFPEDRSASSPGWKRAAVTGLKLAVTMGLLALVFFRFSDPQAIVAHLKSFPLQGLLLPLACMAASLVFFAARWNAILAATARPLRFDALFKATLAALFFSQALPTGLGGDVYRVWYARRAGIALPQAVSSVVLDRVLALAAAVVFIAAALPVLLSLPELAPISLLLIAAPVVAIGGLSVIAILDRLTGILPPLQRPGLAALAASLAALGADGRKLARSWPWGIASFLLALVNQLLFGLTVYGLGQGLGIELPLTSVLILFPPVLLLSMVPISLAGWGVREGAMVYFLGAAGIPAEPALSASILFGLLNLVIALPGGIVWVLDRPAASPTRGQK